MPVTVGSRLERLLDLDRRVKLAIEEERRRELSGAGGRLPEPLVMRQEVLPRPRDDDDGSMWGTREKRACLARRYVQDPPDVLDRGEPCLDRPKPPRELAPGTSSCV